MNTIEHLLVCVNEEALEVGQASDKALRFGMHDGYPDSDTSNLQDMIKEVNELMGALELLQENGVILVGLYDRKVINKKKQRIKKYMEYAKQKKTLI